MTGSRRRTSILVGVGFAGLTYSVASQYVFDSYHKRTRLHNGQNRPPRMLNGTRCDALGEKILSISMKSNIARAIWLTDPYERCLPAHFVI